MDIVMEWCAAGLYWTGCLYLFYLPFRHFMLKIGREEYVDRPWKFFLCIWGFSFLWFLGCLLASAPLLFIVYVLFFLAPMILWAIGPAGLLWMLYDFTMDPRRNSHHPPASPAHRPRFQFRMLDLLAFVAANGSALALLSAYKGLFGLPEAFLFRAAAVSLVCEALAFAMALNVLTRLGEEWPLTSRMGFLIGWLVYATFLFPLALATWLAWRHALDRLEKPDPAG